MTSQLQNTSDCWTNWQKILSHVYCAEKICALTERAKGPTLNRRYEKEVRVASPLPVPEFLWGHIATC